MRLNDDVWFFVSGALVAMEVQWDRYHGATKSLLIAPESPLFEPMSLLSCSLLASLSLLINDNDQTLEWFVYDCDYGRAPKKAGYKGNMRMIDSHDRIRWLLEL